MVEPFIIPTGSMADTLLGAHATRTCSSCGWEFDFAPLRGPQPTRGFTCPPEIACPNCHLRFPASPADTFPKSGDRILVHKWPYAVGGPFAPRRWDVVVFRDPADPGQHYIKRLIGLPGESVEIVDGDVFIDGRIARKPPYVQRALWFIVYDQSHPPADPATDGELPRWVTSDQPPGDGAGWSALNTRAMCYDGLDQVRRAIDFDAGARAECLQDFYAYNRAAAGNFVRDVRLVCEMTPSAGDGLLRLELTTPPHRFSAEIHRDGLLTLDMDALGGPARLRPLHSRTIDPLTFGHPVTIEFGHVDYRLYLRIDGRELLGTSGVEYSPRLDELRRRRESRPASLQLAAQNLRCVLRGLRVDRDVYYISRAASTRRARPGQPFELGQAEYFVLGDNSPDSYDSREWSDAGPHLPTTYRPGTVLANQIVGQAAFVYLPGLLPTERRGTRYLPDVGRTRFVR